MAAVLDSLVQRCAAALEDFSGQEACSALGIRENVRGLLATLSRIDAVVAHEEQRRVLSSRTDAWVAQVKDALYEVDDVLDVCAAEGAKVLADGDHPPAPKVRCAFMMFSCFRSSGPPKFHHEIGFTIRDIDIRLREIEDEMPALPAGSSVTRRDWLISDDNMRRSCHDAAKPRAVGAQVQKSVGGLVPRMIREGKKKVDVFAIVGAVGIGKTTLAREIYTDERMTENFPICVWVKMSKDLSEVAFLKKIISGAGVNVGDTENKEELLGLLSSALSKRFLIVLDDLDSPGIWDDLLKDPLGDGVARGRILITTRDEDVATGLKAIVHRVDRMDAENSWALLREQVFTAESSSEELHALEDVGVKIAEKCEGHPLAIKVIAGVLRSRGPSKAEWETVLNSDAWSMRPLLQQVPQALYLSYVDLPSELKECFLHCSLYTAECPIRRFDLVRRWIAEGLVKARGNKELEESAEEYYLELIGRNLLQPDPDNLDQCWIAHDLLRSLARFLITDESILIDGQQRSGPLSSLSKPRHLALCNMENSLEGPISVKQQMSLRSLMLFNSPNVRVIDDLIVSAPYLRVLDLSNTAVEALPKSIGNLLHLRYLNLDGTQVRDVPSSVGFLSNLQTLSLQGCQRLQKLPWSISALQELRCLCLEGTSLRYVPKGVGELRQLNHLSGLLIGHDGNDPEGCDLDDLKLLSELRYLHMERIDRATTSGAAALANKPFLKVLHLSEQAPLIEEEEEHEEENQEGAEKEEREMISNQCRRDDAAKVSEKIWNELTPPQSVEKLVIKNYQGRKFPNWMTGPKLSSTSFPGLAFLDLDNCTSCTTLPALGRLNQLKSLQISNADSVVAIGSEFLGGTTVLSQQTTSSFPKLEVFKLRNMKKLEDWSLSVEENQILFPSLKSLHIHFCPKLKALPAEGLKHAAALCDLRVEGAHGLTEIKDLPKLSDELYLKDNRALLRISSLPLLQSLTIDDCSKLKHVSGLDMLQHLRLVFPPSTETFYFEELVIFWSIAFPRWLEVLIRNKRNGGLRRFELQCTLPLLRSCLMDGGKNWHVVQQIPEVRITSTDGRKYIRYNKGRRIYETNAQSEQD